jgi:hypothetical protein
MPRETAAGWAAGVRFADISGNFGEGYLHRVVFCCPFGEEALNRRAAEEILRSTPLFSRPAIEGFSTAQPNLIDRPISSIETKKSLNTSHPCRS